MQKSFEGWRKALLIIPWMLGLSAILTAIHICIYVVLQKPKDVFVLAQLCASTAIVLGGFAGWIWGRWALIFPLIVPVTFSWFGYLCVELYYSGDVGWGLPVIINSIITIPPLILGIAVGSFLYAHLHHASAYIE